MDSAVNSLRIVIAADESIKRREVVHLGLRGLSTRPRTQCETWRGQGEERYGIG